MPVGSKNLTSDQLRGLEDEPLADALAEARRELFNLRFQSATGQLESHGRLRAVKKDIARIYTELRERELGIGREPVAALLPASGDAQTDADTTTEDTTDSEKGA